MGSGRNKPKFGSTSRNRGVEVVLEALTVYRRVVHTIDHVGGSGRAVSQLLRRGAEVLGGAACTKQGGCVCGGQGRASHRGGPLWHLGGLGVPPARGVGGAGWGGGAGHAGGGGSNPWPDLSVADVSNKTADEMLEYEIWEVPGVGIATGVAIPTVRHAYHDWHS